MIFIVLIQNYSLQNDFNFARKVLKFCFTCSEIKAIVGGHKGLTEFWCTCLWFVNDQALKLAFNISTRPEWTWPQDSNKLKKVTI